MEVRSLIYGMLVPVADTGGGGGGLNEPLLGHDTEQLS